MFSCLVPPPSPPKTCPLTPRFNLQFQRSPMTATLHRQWKREKRQARVNLLAFLQAEEDAR